MFIALGNTDAPKTLKLNTFVIINIQFILIIINMF